MVIKIVKNNVISTSELDKIIEQLFGDRFIESYITRRNLYCIDLQYFFTMEELEKLNEKVKELGFKIVEFVIGEFNLSILIDIGLKNNGDVK